MSAIGKDQFGATPPKSVSPGVFVRLARNPVAAAGLAVLALIVLTAVIYPLVSPYSYADGTPDIDAGPSAHHWLGTDNLGYDILTRLAVGARVSLTVGVCVELVVLGVGGLVGLIAGYCGGRLDNALMRLTDMMFAFPDILLAILLMAVLGPSLINVLIALGVTGWPGMARLIRGQALAVRSREYVEAGRALGLPTGRIILRHVLPNVLSPVIVASTIDIAGVIIAESTLSFLGIGVQDPLPSWGKLVERAMAGGEYHAHPMVLAYPAICLAVTVLCLNFIGDALRDALDPRSA